MSNQGATPTAAINDLLLLLQVLTFGLGGVSALLLLPPCLLPA